MQASDNSSSTAKSDLLREPLPTPHWGSQGGSAFTVRAIVTTNSDPSTVLETLLDTSAYPAWNNFVPRVAFQDAPDADKPPANAHLKEGVLFTEHVDMFGHGKPSGLVRMRLLMTTLQEGEDSGRKSYTVVWLGKGYPSWALRSERVHWILRNDDGTTTYNVHETFSGPLSLLVRLFVGKALVKRFQQWNEELGRYAEQRTQD